MQIVLTKTLSEKKGWIEGRTVDWIKPTITAMEKHEGNKDWYIPQDQVQIKINEQATRRGRPRKEG